VTDEPIDPENSTSPNLRRGAFVGLSATAAVAGSVAIASSAEQFGAPHTPIVSETDPSIVVFRPVLVSSGRSINSYAAVPKDAAATAPGVVVTMHIWGVDAQIRDTVRRFAKAGYVAIAPDLYSDQSPPSGDGVNDASVFRPLFTKLVPEMVKNDLAAGATWIRTRLPADASKNAKVALIGFCGGGQIALKQTIENPDAYNVASVFYGAVASLDPKGVKVPLIGSYGERDTSIPAADVSAFYSAIAWPHDVKIYPDAGHAFFDDTRKSYVPGDASSAWQRTLGWFGTYIKG
jgi:carboxymethylenebutenolidase